MKAKTKAKARKPQRTQYVSIWTSPSGQFGPWVELHGDHRRLDAREARATAKRLNEMAYWIDAQKAKP